jgi:rubrerythrin
VNKANFIIVHLYGDGSAMLLCSWCNQLFIGHGHPEQCPLCHSAGKLVEAQTEAS